MPHSTWADTEEGGQGPYPAGKSQDAIGLFTYTGACTDPPQEAIGTNYILSAVHMTLCEIR